RDAVDVALRGLTHESVNRRVVAQERSQLRNLLCAGESRHILLGNSILGQWRQDLTVLKRHDIGFTRGPREVQVEKLAVARPGNHRWRYASMVGPDRAANRTQLD